MDILNILVVEDEVLIARELESTLMRLGYNVVGIAVNGEEAIAKAFELQPDLILMDITLPGTIDGIEAAEQIHQTAQLPVIYVSAYDDEAVLQRARATQPVGYLVKPYSDRSLRATIAVALGLSKAEKEMRKVIETAQVQPKNQSQLEPEEISPALQKYLGMAAHEIGNSLGVIQISTELLNELEASPFVKQQAVQHIQKAALRMNWLREDLLTLAQTGVNEYQLQLTDIELVSTSQQLIEMLNAAQQMQNRLRLVSQQEMLIAALDERLVNYLLKNLLLNALKYSPEDAPVFLMLDRQQDKVEIKVQDRGIGIPADYYPYMFQPFQRASNVSKIPGTGLGLAIVKRCVDLLQGEITFNSEVGKGTTFRVVLFRGDKRPSGLDG